MCTDIKQGIINIFAQIFDLTPDQITDELSDKDVAKWDSLAQMQLVVAIEQAFKINLELEEIITMNSVKKIIKILEKKGVK